MTQCVNVYFSYKFPGGILEISIHDLEVMNRHRWVKSLKNASNINELPDIKQTITL